MSDFNQWCKDAGPIGPALWLFDALIKTLAATDSSAEDSDPLFLILLLVACVALGSALGITVATHT